MNYYLKTFMIMTASILITTFILTIVNYFGLINHKILNILIYAVTIISVIIASINIGKTSKKRGFISGLKLGIVITILFSILTLLTHLSFSIKTIIFYAIILTFSMLGGMFGINKK